MQAEEKIIIVALPDFYTLFQKHWHHSSSNIEHIAKDYTKLTVKDLTTKLREHLFEKK
jgi:hypothetical protein